MNSPIGEALQFDELLELPAEKTLVLTVNNRLSRGMTSRYSRALVQRSASLPVIQPWNAWLSQCAFDLTFTEPLDHDPLHVIDPTIARMLWAEVIRERDEQDGVRGLIDIGQLATLAAQADELALHWKVQVDSAWVTPEYEQFALWQSAYEAKLHRLKALDRTRIVLQINDWIEQGRVSLPEHLVLAGFSQPSPAMQDVMALCRKQGVNVRELVPPPVKAIHAPRQVRSATIECQWLQAIDWARGSLQDNPDGRFAIVVPDLQTSAGHVRRLMHRAIGHEYAFNVAVAPPLAQWPAARALLSWLEVVGRLCVQGQVAVDLAGHALLIGHCAGDLSERGARALIDARWRQVQRLSVSLDDWNRTIKPLESLDSAWLKTGPLWQDVTESTRLRWEQWTQLFRQTMGALGFPGNQAQTSFGFQVVQALEALLLKVAGLDEFFEPVTWREALSRLQTLAQQTLFQPQRDKTARLDVLGLLEAEGGQWDAVWVMGLTDLVLPAAVSPNPLLPRSALATAQAPRSTPQREHEWAKRTFETLCELAPSVTMSSPARDEQQPLRPSPFLEQLPLYEPRKPSDPQYGSTELERWSDGTCPPLGSDEVISGGVSVLDTQARNPMWAFLRYRLNTRALEAYARVPSRSLRGTFLHAVMRAVWEHVQTQDQLIEELGSTKFDQWLVETIQTLSKLILAQWPEALATLEEQRTMELVKQWLQNEAKRPWFSKLELEFSQHLQFGPLALKVVLDRVDQDENGELILLDYKTGMSRPTPDKDWKRDAPIDLQMIAYARALRLNKGQWPSAIAWAQLHPRKLEFSGICSPSVQLPGIKVAENATTQQWQEQMQQWDQALEHLAEQFVSGFAQNISWKKSDLQYCDVGEILRLHEESMDD